MMELELIENQTRPGIVELLILSYDFPPGSERYELFPFCGYILDLDQQ